MLKTRDGRPAAKTELWAILTDSIVELLREPRDEAFSFFPASRRKYLAVDYAWHKFASFKIKKAS